MKKLIRASNNSQYRKYAANAYARKVLNDELGIQADQFASPDHGTAYMIYRLPFSNLDTGEIDIDQCKEFEEKFRNILQTLEEELGFEFRNVRTPSVGVSRIRGKWAFKCYGPDVLVDKSTGEVVEILE